MANAMALLQAKKDKKTAINVCIRMTQSLVDRIDLVAETHENNRSEVIKALIESGLPSLETQ